WRCGGACWRGGSRGEALPVMSGEGVCLARSRPASTPLTLRWPAGVEAEILQQPPVAIGEDRLDQGDALGAAAAVGAADPVEGGGEFAADLFGRQAALADHSGQPVAILCPQRGVGLS